MRIGPRRFAIFETALATAFLAEIGGESFFSAPARAEPNPRRAPIRVKLARAELAGDPNSCASRDRYLARLPA